MRALDELRGLKQWVMYAPLWDDKREKIKKQPKNPFTGNNAMTNEPSTWGTYDEAYQAGLRFGFVDARGRAQVGFVFAGGYGGIDLDHVINKNTGEIEEWALEVVKLMDSYTEYSPSGEGLHILFKLQDVEALARELFGATQGKNNQAQGIELYLGGRFFTFTGNVYGEEKPIQERTQQVREVHAKYFTEKAKESVKESVFHSSTGGIRNWVYRPVTTKDIWEIMFSGKNEAKIQKLYQGDTSDYGGDNSRADMALCQYLAYYTHDNPSQMDAMFRESGLYREKWDEKHYSNGETYGQHIINEAIRLRDSNDKHEARESQSGTPKEPQVQTQTSQAQTSEVKPQEQPQETHSRQGSMHNLLEYFDSYYEADMSRFAEFKDRKTGYSNIDKYNSLYPGLYVLGAVSSLGKTTFAHQMADQLAGRGDYVMFFSLEQTELELATKGLARLTAQESMSRAVSAIKIRNGTRTEAVDRAMRLYREFAEHETIIQCGFGTTIHAIKAQVESYIRSTERKPVVFVDYLQAIKPVDNTRQSMKDIVDEHVQALKKLSVDNDLVVILISSFNRQNYMTTVGFESFKESGSIEYTADVVWGLQLLAMNAGIFDSESKTQAKRRFVAEQKNAEPRKIELVGLKNRYGRSNTRYFFQYYAKYDLFVPYEKTEAEVEKEIADEYEAFNSKTKDKDKKQLPEK